MARGPLALRSSKQLAREAILQGAVQKNSELSSLLRLLRDRSPRVVVEIGTDAGGTFYSLCQLAAKNALLVSIDLPGGDFGRGYGEEEIPRMRGFARKGQSLHFLRCDSHRASTKDRLLRILSGRAVDVLFIDGDHTYEGVKADFEMYAERVGAGGLIVFHDVLPHPQVPRCAVDRFWTEIKDRYVHHEYLEPKDDRGWGQWGGIGVLEITGSSPPHEAQTVEQYSRVERN
jgi:predicted O-methyltransferase YrrM